MYRPQVFRLCEQPHECQRCHKTTLCQTYLWCCPWLKGEQDQMCDYCLAHTLTAGETVETSEGMES